MCADGFIDLIFHAFPCFFFNTIGVQWPQRKKHLQNRESTNIKGMVL